MGSILILTILLLMPSIPAIYINEIKQDCEEISLDDDIKFPKLYKFIVNRLNRRIFRADVLVRISTIYDHSNGELLIILPILFYRGRWLVRTTNFLNDFFQDLSDKYGWNWEM